MLGDTAPRLVIPFLTGPTDSRYWSSAGVKNVFRFTPFSYEPQSSAGGLASGVTSRQRPGEEEQYGHGALLVQLRIVSNGQAFNAALAAIGVSEQRGYAVLIRSRSTACPARRWAGSQRLVKPTARRI